MDSSINFNFTKDKDAMKTRCKINLQSWHIWSGIILSIPIFIVGVTAIFSAHEKALGLKKIAIHAGWLPGYSTQSVKTESKEIKCILTTREGRQYVGTKYGLFVFDQEKLYPIEEIKGTDVKNIVECPHGVLVVTNKDVWSFEGTTWEKIFKGDVHNVSVTRDGSIYLSTVYAGLQISHDGGRSWTLEWEIAACLNSLPISKVEQKISFNKLLVDLHTGRALLGKQYSWLWIDIIGFVIVFLTVSGVYLWWKQESQKAEFLQ